MLFEGMSKGLLVERDVPTQALDQVRVAVERGARTLHFQSRVARWGVHQASLLRDVIDEWWGGERLLAGMISWPSDRDRMPSSSGPSSPRDVYSSSVLSLLPAALGGVAGSPTRRLPALDPEHAQMVACASYAELERLCGEVMLCASPEAARVALSEATALAVGIVHMCGGAPDASLLDDWGADSEGDEATYGVEFDGELRGFLRAVRVEATLVLRPALEDVPWPEGACEALVRDVLRADRTLTPWRGPGPLTLLDWARPVPDLRDPRRVTLAEVIAASRSPVASSTAHAAPAGRLSVTRGAARGLAAYCDVARVLLSRSRRVEGDAVRLHLWMDPVSRSALDELRGSLRSIAGDPWEAVS